jgi:hypothetical protein
LPIVAAVGLALVSSVSAKPIAAHGRLDGDASQGQQQIAAKSQGVPHPAAAVIQSDVKLPTGAHKPPDTKPNPSPEQQQATDNLKAQQDMASASARMVYVAGLEALITLAGVILVGFTLYHTREAAKAARDAVGEAKRAADAANTSIDVTREIGQAQVRAYLTCEGATFSIEDDWMLCQPVIRNYGQSPASNVKIRAVVSSMTKEIPGEGRIPPHSARQDSREFGNECEAIQAGGTGKTLLAWTHVDLEGQHPHILLKNAYFSILGRLSWTDVFNGEYRSEFVLHQNGNVDVISKDSVHRRQGTLSAFNHDAMTEGRYEPSKTE